MSVVGWACERKYTLFSRFPPKCLMCVYITTQVVRCRRRHDLLLPRYTLDLAMKIVCVFVCMYVCGVHTINHHSCRAGDKIMEMTQSRFEKAKE
jgi:hypothetical protein